MPFLSQKHLPIPTKDLLSWQFDDLPYDWDKPIYNDALDPSNTISARQAKKAIRQLVAGFKAAGLQPGDSVCIHSFNSIWYSIVFLGIIAAGGIFTGTNPAYTPSELCHALQISKTKFVLVQPELLGSMKKACEQSGVSKILIFNPSGEKVPSGLQSWQSLFEHGEEDWVRFDDKKISANTTAALCFSSGTTGLPKAVMISHYNYVAYHTAMYEEEKRPWEVRRLFAFPMFHATIPVAHTTPLKAGLPCWVLPRFEPEAWFRCHQKYAINEMLLLPPVVVLAINSPLRQKYSLASVKNAVCGAAPLDKGPQARMQELIGGGPFTQVYGMSEATCVATKFPFDEADVSGSVGRPIPNVDMKIVDIEDGSREITGYDVRGELCLRGPSVSRGYFENPDANARDWDVEGFYHTGDIGYCDSETKLWYIVDRKKELIKVRAFQVAPPELEGVLLSHPDIMDAAVIGIPDPQNEGSEMPRAYVVKRPQSTLDKNIVDALIREKLAHYKALTGGIVFVETIPKNASGKILKRLLREQAKSEIGPKI